LNFKKIEFRKKLFLREEMSTPGN